MKSGWISEYPLVIQIINYPNIITKHIPWLDNIGIIIIVPLLGYYCWIIIPYYYSMKSHYCWISQKSLFSHFQMMIFPNLSIQNSTYRGFPSFCGCPEKNPLVAPLRQDVATGLRGLWAQLGAASNSSFLHELQSHEAFGKARQHVQNGGLLEILSTNLSCL